MGRAPTEADIAFMWSRAQETRQVNYIVANAACIFAALVALALRITARRLKALALGVDDWVIIMGTVRAFVFITWAISDCG